MTELQAVVPIADAEATGQAADDPIGLMEGQGPGGRVQPAFQV